MVIPASTALLASAGGAAAQLPLASRVIAAGDLVIVYESHVSMRSVYVQSSGSYVNRYGTFLHKDWIGQPFGVRVHARPPGRGWVLLLAPTPELWTAVLRHRTQILYVADISVVVSILGLRPGYTVLESGTGSGSLTHSLARAVAPNGRVATFDFHEQRAAEAAEEFKRHGLSPLVTVGHRNIEENGFPETGADGLLGAAHAVFLDLPGPWRVVPSASRCLRPGGTFCAFSPCIEQVQRTCEALDAAGFTHLRTLEVLLRAYDVSDVSFDTCLAAATPPGRSDKKRRRGGSAPLQQRQQHVEESQQDQQQDQQQQQVTQVLARPCLDARGHTGYLTFARRFVPAQPLPDCADEEEGDQGGSGDESQ